MQYFPYNLYKQKEKQSGLSGSLVFKWKQKKVCDLLKNIQVYMCIYE